MAKITFAALGTEQLGISAIITDFTMGNPEFSAYALSNLFHLKIFFLNKLGFKKISGAKIKGDVSFEIRSFMLCDEIKNAD
jgi:hypothetical protein